MTCSSDQRTAAWRMAPFSVPFGVETVICSSSGPEIAVVAYYRPFRPTLYRARRWLQCRHLRVAIELILVCESTTWSRSPRSSTPARTATACGWSPASSAPSANRSPTRSSSGNRPDSRRLFHSHKSGFKRKLFASPVERIRGTSATVTYSDAD